eukprot:11011140-Karenia_brevis.AAC.1
MDCINLFCIFDSRRGHSMARHNRALREHRCSLREPYGDFNRGFAFYKVLDMQLEGLGYST